MRKLIVFCTILVFSAVSIVSAQTAKETTKAVNSQKSIKATEVTTTTPASNNVTTVSPTSTTKTTTPVVTTVSGDKGMNKYGLHGPTVDESNPEFRTQWQQWQTNYPDEFNAYARKANSKK
jgi:hypothetical protein